LIPKPMKSNSYYNNSDNGGPCRRRPIVSFFRGTV
jgi:hypothetical protein